MPIDLIVQLWLKSFRADETEGIFLVMKTVRNHKAQKLYKNIALFNRWPLFYVDMYSLERRIKAWFGQQTDISPTPSPD